MNPYVVQDLATEYRREALEAAARARLARLARCCKPTELARALAALRRWSAPRRAVCC